MYSKFPLSTERLPRPRRAACLSLRAGCVCAALVCILYAVLALSQCLSEVLWPGPASAGSGAGGPGAALQWASFATLVTVFTVSLALSALMLVGALRDKAWMMRPWVVFKSLQLAAGVLLLLAAGALHPPAPDRGGLALLAVDFLAILVRFYMLTVVASYVRELEEPRLLPAPGDDEPRYTAL